MLVFKENGFAIVTMICFFKVFGEKYIFKIKPNLTNLSKDVGAF